MFKVRTSLPKLGSPYYNTTKNDGMSKCVQGKMKDTGKRYKGLDVLGNCVGWVNGRVNEAIGKDKMQYQFICNAESFVKYYVDKGYKLELSQTPVAGSVMIWSKGEITGKDGAGHVAFVEIDNKDGSVYTSESGWNSKNPMYNKTRSKGKDGNWGMKAPYKFLGFMIIPELIPEPTPEPEVIPEKPKNELKVGDKVKIVAIGRASSNGNGKVARGIGWKRTILKIHKDKKYPYQVGNSIGTTGFYKAEALKKI
jgi:surface antigen